MNGLLLAQVCFCFRVAVLLTVVLQIFRKESSSKVFWNIYERNLSLGEFF